MVHKEKLPWPWRLEICTGFSNRRCENHQFCNPPISALVLLLPGRTACVANRIKGRPERATDLKLILFNVKHNVSSLYFCYFVYFLMILGRWLWGTLSCILARGIYVHVPVYTNVWACIKKATKNCATPSITKTLVYGY